MREIIERRRALKEKFKRLDKIFGAWTSLAHPSVTETFCRASVDFVGIDIEHSTISQEQSQRIIAAAQGSGSLCLPRIASHNMEMIKRLLDSGADGIIIPMVNTPQELEKIIGWIKFAPQGNRSFGVSRAQGYGFDFEEYTKSWNENSIVIAQIEAVAAVDNIDQILAIKDLDGVMIGPYDLSSSMGIPGQIEHERVKQACQKVIEAAKKHKKACGTQNIDPDKESLKNNFNDGFSFVILASDIFLLWKWAARMKETISAYRK